MDFYIRPVEPGDARGINQLRRMPGVFENLLAIPSERVSRSEEYLARLDGNTHQFVAVTEIRPGEEIIIGDAVLNVYASPRMRHSASIGIMVHKDYQNMGVGSALMKTLIDLADNWLMLVRVELEVYEDNERAIHLYEKFGFVKEGVKKMAVIKGGRYINGIMMARINPAFASEGH